MFLQRKWEGGSAKAEEMRKCLLKMKKRMLALKTRRKCLC